MTKKIRLVLHIGAGKTGTSSIQETLRHNYNRLIDKGIFYAGMNLENSPATNYSWQKHADISFIEKLDKEILTGQLLNATLALGEYCKEKNYHTITWSNEAYIGLLPKLIDFLNLLKDTFIDLFVLLYVRDPVEWAVSAYIQWGLKHKTYNGELQTFSQWYFPQELGFRLRAQELDEAFGDRFLLRNYDAYKDIVLDFTQNILGLTLNDNLAIVRNNDRLFHDELFARIVYNSQKESEALPLEFDVSFNLTNGAINDPAAILKKYLPTAEDLEKTRDVNAAEVDGLNALLRKKNQLEIKNIEPKDSRDTFEVRRLVGLLTGAIIGQDRRISQLETIVNNFLATRR